MSSASHTAPPCLDLDVRHRYDDSRSMAAVCLRCGLVRQVTGSTVRYLRDGQVMPPSDETGLELGKRLAQAITELAASKGRHPDVTDRLRRGDLPWTWAARVLGCTPRQARRLLLGHLDTAVRGTGTDRQQNRAPRSGANRPAL